MAHRGGDEPEYIDDDEFYDPDALRRGASNVLGASGSRKDVNDAPAGSGDARDGNPSGGASGTREPPRSQQNRSGQKPRRGSATVPSQRDSGGKQDPRRAAKASRGKPSDSTRAEEDQQGTAKRRFINLRSPFQRKKASDAAENGAKKDAGPRDKNGPDKNEKTSKLKAFTSRVGKLRHGLNRAKAAEEAGSQQPGRRSSSISNKSSVRAAFGASRGETQRTRRESQSVGMSRDRMQRADADGQQSSPSNRPSKAPIFKSSEWLDLDRKLDLIGVGLVFGAIVLFFSALSREQAAIAAVHKLIGHLLGWGALAVPITMFAIGMWLIVRHFGDQAPLIDPVRLTGAITAFIGVLVLFQFGESLNYGGDSYCAPECLRGLVESSYLGGRGGGLIGGWIYQVLVINLTEVGGFVIVVMVLTFATMMITGLSMAELATVTVGVTRSLRDSMAQRAARRRAQQLQMEALATQSQPEAILRISKPEAAKLSGSVAGVNALPEASGLAMPIPLRLRDMLFKRVSIMRAATESSAETAANDSQSTTDPERQGSRIFGRFFSGGAARASDDRSHAAATDTKAPSAAKPRVKPNWRSPASSPAPPLDAAAGESNAIAPQRPRPAPFLSRSGGAPTAPMERQTERPAQAPPKWQPEALTEAPTKRQIDEGTRAPQVIRPADNANEPLDAFSNPIIPSEQLDNKSRAVMKTAPEAANSIEPLPQAAKPLEPEDPAVATGSTGPERPRVDWHLPESRELLMGGSIGELDEEALRQQALIIEDTLASFGAPGRVVKKDPGPRVTQFGVEPDYLTARSGKRSRVKVSAIAKLDKDLQLALGAKRIRIEAPVPGKGYVGIEVPNKKPSLVSLRDVMESRSFQSIDSPLAIALGKSVDGRPVSADLTQMPHLLIAGTTGSGKSKCINAIIISILANRSPDEVKFIMVDPKRVELTGYNGLPHLVAPVVVELEKTVGVLRWLTREMDERYKKFSKVGARHLIDYNHILAAESPPMPYIVVIIDELADLMMAARDDTESTITRIAAMARATGIHLIIATQRPSVDVVTGLIKANIPARIAFAVAGSVNSSVILDQPGAERLLGKGDMLYLSGNAPAPQRMQGVFVSDEEIHSISQFWKLQNLGLSKIEPISRPAGAGSPKKRGSHEQETGAENVEAPSLSQTSFWDSSKQRDKDLDDSAMQEEDRLYEAAVEIVRRQKKASISFLQRRLRIGYNRAARIVDMMEERGVVGPPKEGSSKPRDVLPE